MIPLSWIVLGLLGLLAFRGGATETPAPQPAAAPALPALDPHMPAEVHRAVWRCYGACADPGYLRAFSAELVRAGFPMGANLLAIRAGQLAPAAPTPAPTAAPAPTPAPAAQPIPLAHLRAIAALSPEQRATFFGELTEEQRGEIQRLLVSRGFVKEAAPKPAAAAASPASSSSSAKALPEPNPVTRIPREVREPAAVNGAPAPATTTAPDLEQVKAEG